MNIGSSAYLWTAPPEVEQQTWNIQGDDDYVGNWVRSRLIKEKLNVSIVNNSGRPSQEINKQTCCSALWAVRTAGSGSEAGIFFHPGQQRWTAV